MRYAIGIDLHGTLLDDRWQIPGELRGALAAALDAVSAFSRVYVCTGNDLTFISRHVPDGVRRRLAGYILETGCVVSDGREETIIVPQETVARIQALEAGLRQAGFPGVRYFARRLCTVSLFTRTESGGSDPAGLMPDVERRVAELGFGAEVLVTHSNVAVDIIPAGFNKFTGIRHAASGLGTIGIADSLNDIHLLTDADFAFVPANGSAVLLRELETGGHPVRPLAEFRADERQVVWRSRGSNTAGVVEILEAIHRHLA